MSAPQPPYNRFPYGHASLVDAYAWGLRRTLVPPPLTFELMGMASYAPSTFHELLDDEVESDGSSIGDVRLATVCPRSALWQTLWGSHWWLS